jgi:threonine aldolase
MLCIATTAACVAGVLTTVADAFAQLSFWQRQLGNGMVTKQGGCSAAAAAMELGGNEHLAQDGVN